MANCHGVEEFKETYQWADKHSTTHIDNKNSPTHEVNMETTTAQTSESVVGLHIFSYKLLTATYRGRSGKAHFQR